MAFHAPVHIPRGEQTRLILYRSGDNYTMRERYMNPFGTQAR